MDATGRKVCVQNGDDFPTRKNGPTRGKAALLSSEHSVTGRSIKPKLNVRADGEKILAMDQRLDQVTSPRCKSLK